MGNGVGAEGVEGDQPIFAPQLFLEQQAPVAHLDVEIAVAVAQVAEEVWVACELDHRGVDFKEGPALSGLA